MISPGEISSAARKVHTEAMDLKNAERRFSSTLGGIDTWWKGQAGKAFAEDYNQLAKRAMERLYSEMENMKSGLDRLASEVRSADEQRRRKELLERQRKALK
ncbi:MAG: WXG100 family type VII secretion target [Paenibacillus macerans]|uniref:WXG100 family type VII secretion target n=1 Tax=Paenibacillus macerans TaxID=44252 RepID=UPI00242BB47A|nr:WXG100 family type VII secretion target [Paenibacillus macerans]MBS5914416.1 WXG100 family type VII secretion target [Paenibacillus macerans]